MLPRKEKLKTQKRGAADKLDLAGSEHLQAASLGGKRAREVALNHPDGATERTRGGDGSEPRAAGPCTRAGGLERGGSGKGHALQCLLHVRNHPAQGQRHTCPQQTTSHPLLPPAFPVWWGARIHGAWMGSSAFGHPSLNYVGPSSRGPGYLASETGKTPICCWGMGPLADGAIAPCDENTEQSLFTASLCDVQQC